MTCFPEASVLALHVITTTKVSRQPMGTRLPSPTPQPSHPDTPQVEIDLLPPRKPSVLTFATRPQSPEIVRRNHAWLAIFCSFTLSSGSLPSLVDSRAPFLASLRASCSDIIPRPIASNQHSIPIAGLLPRLYQVVTASTGLHLFSVVTRHIKPTGSTYLHSNLCAPHPRRQCEIVYPQPFQSIYLFDFQRQASCLISLMVIGQIISLLLKRTQSGVATRIEFKMISIVEALHRCMLTVRRPRFACFAIAGPPLS